MIALARTNSACSGGLLWALRMSVYNMTHNPRRQAMSEIPSRTGVGSTPYKRFDFDISIGGVSNAAGVARLHEPTHVEKSVAAAKRQTEEAKRAQELHQQNGGRISLLA